MPRRSSAAAHRSAPHRAIEIRPTQQRAGAPSGAPGLLLCQEAGVSPALLVVVPSERPTRLTGDDRFTVTSSALNYRPYQCGPLSCMEAVAKTDPQPVR